MKSNQAASHDLYPWDAACFERILLCNTDLQSLAFCFFSEDRRDDTNLFFENLAEIYRIAEAVLYGDVFDRQLGKRQSILRLCDALFLHILCDALAAVVLEAPA